HTVSVKVTDKDNGSDTKTFSVHVNNVAPTVTLDTNNDQSVNEGSTVHNYSYSISDPGQHTDDHVTTTGGDDGVKGTESNSDASRSFHCTFPDGDATSTPSVSATDSDHETGNTASQDVTIHNVAPTVTLATTNDLTVDEGSTHTYSFMVTDPGNDTF